MTEGLREFDDSIGKCCHCRKLVFKTEDWTITDVNIGSFAHMKCKWEYERRMSQI